MALNDLFISFSYVLLLFIYLFIADGEVCIAEWRQNFRGLFNLG